MTVRPRLFLAHLFIQLLIAQAKTRPHGLTQDPQIFSSLDFDYLIVGGGTAGLIAAARLSEMHDVNVGVIEAGQVIRNDPNIDLIINYGMALGKDSYDWKYTSVPQQSLGGRVIGESTGKVLGGSSAICDVLWQRASAKDYDVWGTELGNGPEWSFEGLRHYFHKAESWSEPPTSQVQTTFNVDNILSSRHQEGPVKVSYNNYIPEPIFPFVATANKLGIPINNDPDNGDAMGILTPARAINPETGNRTYTLDAYIDPISHRSNLLILTGALATRLDLEKGQDGEVSATGVEYVVGGENFHTKVLKEVILAAGSFKTPQILELSGIGNKTLLESFGINTVLDLPGVGDNLMDQTAILMDYEVKKGIKTLDELRLNATFLQEQAALFAETRTGVFTYDTPAVANVPLPTLCDSSDLDHLQTLFDAYASREGVTDLQKAQYRILQSYMNSKEDAWIEFLLYSGGGYASLPQGDKTYVTPFAFHLHPMSRGRVHIHSTNPLDAPLIDPRYFDSPFDLHASALSAVYIRKWMSTPPMSDILVGPNSPLGDISTAETFKEYVRQVTMSTSHPIGTAAMAPREWGGVVSPKLRVYGTKNIRVIDASIQPMTIGVAPLTTVYAIAEKAADMIKADA